MSSLNLSTLEGCQEFVQNSTPECLARQILEDQQLCRSGGIPSLLVYCLPTRTDGIAWAISETPNIPLSIARMRLSSIVSIIKNHLATISRPTPSEAVPAHLIPSDAEYDAALKVLRYLQLPQTRMDIGPSTRVSIVEETIQTLLLQGADFRKVKASSHPRGKHCYVCMFKFQMPHRLYPALCNPCGEFNIASSSLSLPDKLSLSGKTALVTGGRINLGYHTALRLLRCGAMVVVSSRYPRDAESRYLKEADSAEWKDRLKVVGADFRSAKDVFGLVNAVLGCLRQWNYDETAKLDILVNNAAQTLTDSVQREEEQIKHETSLNSSQTLLLEGSYSPRVRGGIASCHLESSASKLKLGDMDVPSPAQDPQSAVITAKNAKSSSWVQTISNIPYEDVISAHSVNTFVPFILVRELLPYMGSSPIPPIDTAKNGSKSVPSKAGGYIVNVSSREGLFESKPSHRSKHGHHVHTNMSKAALNMLTETEAGPAWKHRRVAMNTVDPGYMSADPVYMDMVGRSPQECPIGWEDGAGRLLWPIAKGERGEVVRGRFLKHFRVVDVVR